MMLPVLLDSCQHFFKTLFLRSHDILGTVCVIETNNSHDCPYDVMTRMIEPKKWWLDSIYFSQNVIFHVL